MAGLEPMGDFLAAVAAMRSVAQEATNLCDEVLHLSTFGGDPKGKTRKDALEHAIEALRCASKCGEIAIDAFDDLPREMVYLHDLEHDSDEGEDDEDE